MNATVIQQERLEKLRGIAFGDVSDAIKSLQLVFEQRGEVARAILKGGEADHFDALNYLDNIIKKTLWL